MENLLFKTEENRILKQFGNGLNKYVQTHCQVTLTDDGFRIYRTPNVNLTDHGSTMWGGLILQPEYDNVCTFIKNHTYILTFHVKGKSTNAADFGWSNQSGWGGGGLDPSPSNVSYYNPVIANFNGEGDFWYKFTINDDIYKVCTTTYSGFTSGKTYLSYRDFKFGFSYQNTGSMGTDLYITNIRMYDITDSPSLEILKNGVVEGQVIENNSVKIMNTKDIITTNFIEI